MTKIHIKWHYGFEIVMRLEVEQNSSSVSKIRDPLLRQNEEAVYSMYRQTLRSMNILESTSI